ncbi:MAG: LytTR family DNA-binding domain-containing protein [Flavobacteriaceae bacterium]|nr:LytTR family DNA-binding domain-containing protein [Flavobacteriaceae bacterium]
MQYRFSIIESEKSTIESLQTYFSKSEKYLCVGVSGCYDKSLDIILEHAPDVVFVNVDNLPTNKHLTAFNFVNELYKYLQELPHFIALSTSTKYAYACIKNNFFDYILKPVNNFELRKSISRLSIKTKEASNKLCLKSYKDYRFVDLDEILFLKADNTATDFFMNDGSTISAYKTLKFFESILPENFIRIHNSYIVNQNYISRIHFGKSKCTLKYNSQDVPFSRSYRNNVIILEKTLSKSALLSLN